MGQPSARLQLRVYRGGEFISNNIDYYLSPIHQSHSLISFLRGGRLCGPAERTPAAKSIYGGEKFLNISLSLSLSLLLSQSFSIFLTLSRSFSSLSQSFSLTFSFFYLSLFICPRLFHSQFNI